MVQQTLQGAQLETLYGCQTHTKDCDPLAKQIHLNHSLPSRKATISDDLTEWLGI